MPGRVGLGAVDAGVGADLHVVLDDDVAQLGNLVEASLRIGHESETVGADHHAGVQDAVRDHGAPFVDLHPGVEYGVVADGDAASEVDLRIDLTPLADAHVLLDDREVADVTLVAHLGFGRYRRAVADSLAAGFGGVVHFEELQDAGPGVVHLDERRSHRLRGREGPIDQHDRRARGVEKLFVFGIGEVAQRSGLALLDRRNGVHLGVFVADDFAAQKSGDHFS